MNNKTLITTDHFERITNDVNGNPRYVLHFTMINCEGSEINTRYEAAIKACKRLVSCRKYHNKKYGGGIVFSTYNIYDLCDRLNTIGSK